MNSTVSGRRSARRAIGLGVLLVGILAAVSCSERPTQVTTMPVEEEPYWSPQDDFWASLEALCGLAFEGEVVEDSTGNPDFAVRPMVMHVRVCDSDRILVPFHVGEDRSRTWVLTRTVTGLRLKHDHRHEDGSEDEITQYGGDTVDDGTVTVQEFHADEFTASLIAAAATNIWSVEIVPGERFAYALRREGTDRRFRVEFDLSRPVQAPPAPWGH